MMNKNLIMLLGCLGAGDKTVMETDDDQYVPVVKYVHRLSCVVQAKERSVEGRLQYELFGEYPLSETKLPEWEKMKKVLRIPVEARAFHDKDYHYENFSPEFKGRVLAAIGDNTDLYIKDHVPTVCNGFGLYAKKGADVIEAKLYFDKKYKG